MSDAYTVIFDAPGQATIITLYVLILILGILFNAAIIWVILSKFFFFYNTNIMLQKLLKCKVKAWEVEI